MFLSGDLLIDTPLNLCRFREMSLVQFNIDLNMECNSTFSMETIIFGGTLQGASIFASLCVLGSVDEGTYPTFRACNGILERCNLVNSLQVTEGSSILFDSLTIQGDAATGQSGALTVNPGSFAQLYGQSGVVGDSALAQFQAGSSSSFAGDLEVSGGGEVLGYASSVVLDFGACEYVWGADGATVRLRRTDSLITFSLDTIWSSDGNYSHPDGAGGTTSAPLSNLPLAPSLASMPNYNVGVIPDR